MNILNICRKNIFLSWRGVEDSDICIERMEITDLKYQRVQGMIFQNIGGADLYVEVYTVV